METRISGADWTHTYTHVHTAEAKLSGSVMSFPNQDCQVRRVFQPQVHSWVSERWNAVGTPAHPLARRGHK